jgi:hypothetical protein
VVVPGILALGKLRQEDGEFVSLKPTTWAKQQVLSQSMLHSEALTQKRLFVIFWQLICNFENFL